MQSHAELRKSLNKDYFVAVQEYYHSKGWAQFGDSLFDTKSCVFF